MNSTDAIVGIDLVRIPNTLPLPPAFVLSSTERIEFRKASEEDQKTLFAIYWSLKEAILKALGLGMSQKLQMNQVSLGHTRAATLLSNLAIFPAEGIAVKSHIVQLSIHDGPVTDWVYSTVLLTRNPKTIATTVQQADLPNEVKWKWVSPQDIISLASK